MKKIPPLVFAILFIVLLWPASLQAAESLWQIDLLDDGSIYESLTLDQVPAFDPKEWEQKGAEGDFSLERRSENWQAYQALEQRIPIEAASDNYIVLRRITISWDKDKSADFLREVVDSGSGRLMIRIPGIIKESSADEVKDMTASWEFNRLLSMEDGHKLLIANVFDGLILGALLFGTGFLIIIIWFLGQMRRVEDLIREKYSLENIGQEEEQDEDDDW